MPFYRTLRDAVDKADQLELVLQIPSFAGGENLVSPDQEMKSNESREIKNWDVDSLGAMTRANGCTRVIVGSPTYTKTIDLAVHHFEGTNTYTFYLTDGELVKKSSDDFVEDSAGDSEVFTSGVLSHAVSAASALWITNSTDNLKRKVVGSDVAAPAGVPSTASDRIYEHNFRLIAEGNSAKTIYGSRAGTGNWTSADAWSASNDAWSMTMPDLTQGCVPGFPSGNDLTAFTKFDTFVIYNQPNVSRRRVINGIGCWNAMTIAKGNEGVYFFSTYPTLGVFLWDGNQFINLTAKHTFQDKVNLLQRMFGAYKDNKYYFIYNETGSGVTHPNKVKVYDARFGRWWTRELNSAVSDTLGYPCLLTKDNNELYVGSSQKANVYDLDDATTSDNGEDTQASYTTKVFTSKDFGMAVDNVRLKLLKTVMTYASPGETLSMAWTADRGRRSGAQSWDVTESGDLLNSTFTVNSSNIIGTTTVKTVAKSYGNSAIGREFEFEITDRGHHGKAQVRQLRITAVALEDY